MAGFRPCGAWLGDVMRVLGPVEDASDGLLRHQAMKKPIGRTEGRSSPVVFRPYTIAGALMLPLPSGAIAKQRLSA